MSRAALEPLPHWTPGPSPCSQRHLLAQSLLPPASPPASAASQLLTFQLHGLAKTAKEPARALVCLLGPCHSVYEAVRFSAPRLLGCSHSGTFTARINPETRGLQGEPGKQGHQNTLSQVCIRGPLEDSMLLVLQAQWCTAGSLRLGAQFQSLLL